MTKRPALGRGLSALLEDNDKNSSSKEDESGIPKSVGSTSEIEISKIQANPFQPRTKFEAEALEELAQSIRELGIIQPVSVRKMGYDNYQLISGERRFRASQMAGLTRIPAYIRVANDQSMLEMALVENIQRSELDAMEVAFSYQRLIEECSLTQEELSKRVGKKRSTIANYLRLIKLPAIIQDGIRNNKISMGHARSLINIDDPETQIKLYEQIIEETLSVRKVEELVKESKTGAPKRKSNPVLPLSLVDKKIKRSLSEKLKVNVGFQRNDVDKGKIIVPFNSEKELETILKIINRSR
tara:strand:+ start:11269 stop:12165 length:897 start_codon:yes stop_codon:yes gene_type:complete